MRIVHVIPALTKGGAEKVVVSLANALVGSNEVTVLVAAPADPTLLQDTLSDAVEVRFVTSSGSRLRRYLAIAPWVIRHWGWLKSRDIVHCHLTFGSIFGFVVTLARWLTRARFPRVVETYHAVGAPIPKAERLLHAFLARARDGFVLMANDQYWSSFVRRHSELPTTLILNGIELDLTVPVRSRIDAYRDSMGIPADAFVLGSVGRLVRDRRPDMLLEVFRNVAQVLPEVHFLLAGAGDEHDRLCRLAEEAGLGERLHMPGLVREVALPFSVIDLYLTLNVASTTGIAGLEAAAFGLPIIAYQANQSYVPGADDWIFSSTDPAAVAAEAVRLVRAPDERRRLAANQQNHVRAQFSAEAMTAAYLAFYERLLPADESASLRIIPLQDGVPHR